MVDMHLVVQSQRVIAVAPVVTDALFTVHDQRIDPQLTQARGDRKPRLPPAHDQHDRISLDILGRRFPEVEPVGTPKIARVGAALGPRSPNLFLEPFDFVERREQRPRFQLIAIPGVGDQP
jgi:hypothetical protein